MVNPESSLLEISCSIEREKLSMTDFRSNIFANRYKHRVIAKMAHPSFQSFLYF